MNDLVVLTRHLCLALFAINILCSSLSHGQPPAGSQTEPTPATRQVGSVGSIQEIGPKVYHLLDKQGEPIVVPDFSFEKLEQLIRLERNLLPRQSPRYQYTDRIRISGTAHEQYVAIEVTVQVHLPASEASSDQAQVRIPLRLNQAIPDQPIYYDGPGELSSVAYSEVEGHIVWLRAKPDSDHTIRLQGKVPVRRVGNESHFSLLAPLGGLRVALSIPETDLKASLSDASSGMLSLNTAAESTDLLVQSNGGHIALAWRKENQTPRVLESVGTMTAQFDGRQLTCDAQLNVRSHGSPLESILIRLPPEMGLISTDPGNNELQIDSEGIAADEASGKVIRVRRKDGRDAAEFEVRLRAMRLYSQERAFADPIQIAGFDVLGAGIQSGTVEVEVRGDWDTEFSTGDRIRQVAQFSDALRQRDVAARFKYTGQPFSLQILVRERKSRVNVEPVFTVFLDPDRARLEADLNYRISGARTSTLRLDLNGWQLDEISPAELLSQPGTVDDLGRLTIRLATNSYSLPGEFALQIQAHRELSIEAPVSFELPRPLEENTPTAAALAIVPADNVQLSPRSEEIQELLAEPLPADLELPLRQQVPLFFRETPAAEAATFVADMQIRERTVAVSTDTLLRFTQRQIAVQQRFRYHVDYEPLSELKLEVPSSLTDNETLRVEINDQPLQVEFGRSLAADEPNGPTQNARLDLLEDQIGDFELVVTYTIPADFASADSTTVVVPLVLASQDANTSFEHHTLRLHNGEGMQVELQGDGWSRVSSETVSASLTEPIYDLIKDNAKITAAVTINSSPKQSTTRLHRVWAQTWLTGSVRRDRVVYQLSTNEEHVQLQLPPGIAANKVQVLVGNRLWNDVTALAADAIDIELENTATAKEYTIELWYWFDAHEAALGRVSVQLPAVAGIDKAQRLYWQLVLPENEHLLWAPKGLTRQYQWQWNKYHWGRQSNQGLRDLERLLSASAQDSLPAARNEYLFSTVGPLQAAQFHTTSRATFVLAISGVVLVCGLLLIYVPLLRHPSAILVAGVGVLAVGCLFPEPTVFAVQASMLGLVLVLVARLLQWSLASRRYQLAPVINSTARVADSKPSERSLSVSEGSSRLPTTLSPGPFHIPAAESES